jgi:hypothetical protein
VVRVVVRADHVLHRQAHVRVLQAVRGDVDVLEVAQERRPVVPVRRLGELDDVVAVQRGHRDRRDVVGARPAGERAEVLRDAQERRLVVVDEVHLVDDRDDMRNAQQRGDEGVAA